MTNDITLIESEKLDELLEKAILYDILAEENQLLYTEDLEDINKKAAIRKANYLAKYIEIPMDFDDTIVDKLDELGYE